MKPNLRTSFLSVQDTNERFRENPLPGSEQMTPTSRCLTAICVCVFFSYSHVKEIYIYFLHILYIFFKASIAENRHERISQEFGYNLSS